MNLQSEALQRIQKESDIILSTYRHFFDVILVNNDVEESVTAVEEALEKASSTPQWVPVSWVYWAPSARFSLRSNQGIFSVVIQVQYQVMRLSMSDISKFRL